MLNDSAIFFKCKESRNKSVKLGYYSSLRNSKSVRSIRRFVISEFDFTVKFCNDFLRISSGIQKTFAIYIRKFAIFVIVLNKFYYIYILGKIYKCS